MATEWYCRIMGEEWGPMSAQELIAVARWGRLTRDDTVRRGSDGSWVRAELVRGLFNASPVAATVTSHRLVVAARKAAPARRSVRKIVPTQYWVKVGEKIAGPLSSAELRQLAERGSLKPLHLISRDRRHWVRAAQVKGLSFGGASSQARTMSVRAAVWLDQPLAPQAAPTAAYGNVEFGGGVLAEAGR